MPQTKYQPISTLEEIQAPNNEKMANTTVMQFIILCLIIFIVNLLYTKSTYDFSEGYFESVMDAEPTNSSATAIIPHQNFAYQGTGNLTATLIHTKRNISNKYYVYTSKCHMLAADPFTPKLRKIYHPKSYEDCAKDEPFVSVGYNLNSKRYTLHMNTENIAKHAKASNFSAEDVRCCYRQIVRSGSGSQADKSFTLLKCTIFLQDFVVPTHIDSVIIECYRNSTILLQKDAFSFIQYRNSTALNVTITLEATESKKPSILMIGIDSLSRINLRRTMPLTFKYLQTNNWFELQGYNKMGDNTFPNLMAVLTSYDYDTAYKICSPTSVGGLNKPVCNLIWNRFHEFGYRTAYAEDCTSLSTFNYLKKGFDQPPTDYYLRPMMLAIEKNLNIKKKDGLAFCIGRKHYAEYVYDYAVQFANVYQYEPYFGFFWANSFSHNAYDTPATMDKKVFEYLNTFEHNGVLNNAIVFFFSDHGMRWGSLLDLPEGFLEERLPMMFLSLPGWYRAAHPSIVQALQVNRNRLTSPFDIYATLKQILEMGESEKRFPVVNGTRTGLSLFEEVPENRTCLDVGISEHWCTCVPYLIVNKNDKTVKKAIGLVIEEMNKYLRKKGLGGKCSKLKLEKIDEAKLKSDIDDEKQINNTATYTITYLLDPSSSKFQVTADYNKTSGKININVEDISRLDRYAETAKCIDDKEAKKYCICPKNETKKP